MESPLVIGSKSNGTDAAAKGSPWPSGCRGNFRDRMTAILGCFTVNSGNIFAFQGEILGVTNAIEIAFDKGWNNLWLECGSQLVAMVVKDSSIVTWKFGNKWRNHLVKASNMNFRVTHIFREGDF